MWIILLSITSILGIGTAVYFFYRAYILAGLLADAEDYNSEVERYSNYMYRVIEQAYYEMKQIDRLGAFESDDESGTTFKLLLQVVEELYEEFNGTTKEEE